MKNILKIISIIIMLFLIMDCCVLASNYELPSGITHGDDNADKAIRNGAGIVLGVFQIIGVAAALVMLVMLAIKYMSAAPSEKADIKKGAVAYIIGAVFLFGASVVLNIISQFADEIFG